MTKTEINENPLLDILKVICAALIVGSHSLPIFKSDILNTYYGQWFFRFCVPLFFISSGFFFQKMNKDKKLLYIKRILIIYLISSIIYFPIIYKSYPLTNVRGFLGIIKTLIFGYYHLWYLSALFFSLLISYFFDGFFALSKHSRIYVLLLALLLIIGVFFDEYYKLFDCSVLNFVALQINRFGSTRHFLFMGIPLLTIGRLIYHLKEKIFKINYKVYVVLGIIFFALSFLELYLLRQHITDITCDLTFFNLGFPVCLFVVTFYWKPAFLKNRTTYLRKMVDIVYIVHVLFVFIIFDYTSLRYSVAYIVILALSLLLAILLLTISKVIKK